MSAADRDELQTAAPIRLLLPADPARTGILPGSAIVSDQRTEDGRVRVDYEGDRYGSQSMRVFADRAHHAWGRHTANDGRGYPTVARAWLPAGELTEIGWYDPASGAVTVDDDDDEAGRLLAGWLDMPAVKDSELLTTCVMRHQMLRDCQRALRSGDPKQLAGVAYMSKRYNLGIHVPGFPAGMFP